MSIYNHLSYEQIGRIINIICLQCNRKANREITERNRIGDEALYKRLTKCRKAHDITGEIYLVFFYPENRIDNLVLLDVSNGYYSQPELRNDEAIIHIYHWQNPLNSRIVQDRLQEGKYYYCLMYRVDSNYRLQQVKAVCFHNDIKSCSLPSETATCAMFGGR